MIIESQAVGPFFKNGFVLACESTREAVLIDPGDEVAGLLSFIETNRLTVGHILLTHAHVDHVTGVAAAKHTLGAPVYLHREDLFLYEQAVESGVLFGIDVEPQPPIDLFYGSRQTIAFGGYEVRPHHTPGHCPGGVCLQVGETGAAGKQAVRRRHAVCWLHWPHRSSGRRLRHAHPLDSDGPVRVGRRCRGVSRARTHNHHRTIGRERRTNPFMIAT